MSDREEERRKNEQNQLDIKGLTTEFKNLKEGVDKLDTKIGDLSALKLQVKTLWGLFLLYGGKIVIAFASAKN